MAIDLRLTRYQQTVKQVPAGDAYDIARFSGVSPILILKDQTVNVVMQTGEAIAWGKWVFVAPTPLAGSVALDLPQPVIERVSPHEWKTSWSYVLAFATALTTLEIIAAEKYPASPTFQAVT